MKLLIIKSHSIRLESAAINYKSVNPIKTRINSGKWGYASDSNARSYLQHAFHVDIILEDLLGTRDMSMIRISVSFSNYFVKIRNGIRALYFPLSRLFLFAFHDNFRIQVIAQIQPVRNFLFPSSCPTSRIYVSRATESDTLDKFPLYLFYVVLVTHYPGWGMREERRWEAISFGPRNQFVHIDVLNRNTGSRVIISPLPRGFFPLDLLGCEDDAGCDDHEDIESSLNWIFSCERTFCNVFRTFRFRFLRG